MILRGGVNQAGEAVTYLLHYSDKSGDFPAPFSCADILTGTQYGKGERIPLAPWDVKVLVQDVPCLP